MGIVTAIGQAASYGWQDLLELLALITVNLGILNLLPFPALDGGKVVFLVIEGVTGHAVPEKSCKSVLTPCNLRAAVRADALCNLQRYSPAHHRDSIRKGEPLCGRKKTRSEDRQM